MVPLYFWMLLNIMNLICYKLLVTFSAFDPVLSNTGIQPAKHLSNWKPSNDHFKLTMRFMVIIMIISFIKVSILIASTFALLIRETSKWGIVTPCFRRQFLAVTRPRLAPDGCDMTMNTAVEVPYLLASPKQWRSMLLIFSWYVGRALAVEMLTGSQDSHFHQLFASSQGNCVFHLVFISHLYQ